MEKLDLYWASNKDWYYCEGCIAILADDAPPEAKASYDNCMRQLKSEKVPIVSEE